MLPIWNKIILIDATMELVDIMHKKTIYIALPPGRLTKKLGDEYELLYPGIDEGNGV